MEAVWDFDRYQIAFQQTLVNKGGRVFSFKLLMLSVWVDNQDSV